MVDLTKQVALVTGGGQGLGRAFAIALAEAGERVAVTARCAASIRAETVEMVERAGGRAVAIRGDVAERGTVTHVVSTAESLFGPVDILVNNAGVLGPLWLRLGRGPRRVVAHLRGQCAGIFPICPGGGAGRYGRAPTGPDRQRLQQRRVQSKPSNGGLLRHQGRRVRRGRRSWRRIPRHTGLRCLPFIPA